MQKVENQKIGIHCILACLYFLLLPTTIAINSAGNSILKLATIPIGLFFLVTLLFYNQKLHINGVHLSLILFTLSAVASLFMAADSVSINYVTGYILNAALYVCMTVVSYNKAELEMMEKVQIALLIILNILTLFSGGMLADRTTLMIMGQISDPNYFVGFFIFPLTIALKNLVSGKKRILYLLLISVSLYSVFLSGSRGGFLAVASTITFFAIIYPSSLKKRFFYLAGGLVLLALLWAIVKPLLPDSVVERMTIDAVVESGGTGRMDIWKSMIREILDNPDKLFFGRGINSFHKIFLFGEWANVVAHNQVVQITYNQGLVGLVSFLLLIGISFFRCIKRRKTVAIAILGMMVLSISLSFNQTTRTFWNLIAYAALVLPENEPENPTTGGVSDNE